MRLDHVSWVTAQKYFAERDIVMLAVGSTENHGRHAALGTDTILPNRIMELIEQQSDMMILPTIPYGNAQGQSGFPGTISIGHDMLRDLVYRVCMEVHAWGVRKFVIVNGHGGNTAALEEAAFRLDKQGALMAIVNWWSMVWELNPAWKGGHGGGEETSGLLAVSENLVDRGEIADNRLIDLSENLRSTGFRTVSFRDVNVLIPRAANKVMSNGWFGPDHPKTATKEWGEPMLQAAADFVAAFAREFERLPLGESK